MSTVKFGIVGTGMIARVIAGAIQASERGRLVAVCSRRQATADPFTADFSGVAAVEGVDALLARDDLDAVYIATPTAPKERIALAAVAAGKHILVDKPFVDAGSVRRMAQAAAAQNVLFMDATHFVHHPRTGAIQAAIPDRTGTPRSLHTAFYFPFLERDNIRFKPDLEPMSALGDMGWYSMRAVVEYLQPQGALHNVAAVSERDAETGAVVRVSGLLGFEGGESSTFDIGYTAGTVIMDLSLLGTRGMITLDDFVLDWTDSFAFTNPDIETGYLYRTDLATRRDFEFVPAPSAAAHVCMIERFAHLASADEIESRAQFASAAETTQQYLDAIWSVLAS